MRRDWTEVIDSLNKAPSGTLRVRMGSPGSAQVTRTRLLEDWNDLDAHTEGDWIVLSRIRGAVSRKALPTPETPAEGSILACFSALGLDAARGALERAGVDADTPAEEADLDSVCQAIGKLVAGRESRTLGALLPCLSLRPEALLPVEQLSVRAGHTFRNNAIETIGQLARMTTGSLLSLKNTGRKTVLEIAEFSVRLHTELALKPDAARYLHASIAAVAAEPEAAELMKLDPALAALSSILQRLGPWAADVRSARSLGDLLEVRSELGELPAEIEGNLRELMGTSVAHLRASRDAAQLALNRLLEVLEDRAGRLFADRELSPERLTLEEIGQREGLSRERVRQLCVRAEEELRSRLALPELAVLRWRLHDLRAALRTGVPADSPLIERALERACRDLEDNGSTPQLMLWAAGPYRLRNGWLLAPGASAPTLPTTEELFGTEHWISLDRMTEWVVDHGFRPEVTPAILERSHLRNFGEVWAPWSGSVVDKAEVVLRFLGRPADSREIVQAIGEGHHEPGVRDRLFNDDRFMRTNKREFALTAWSLEEYSGIAQEILERIERDGGATPLEPLVEELVATFYVSEGSVRAYAEAPMFVVENGSVRRRNADEGHSIDDRIESVKGLFPDPTGKLVHLAIRVDANVLRGSGMSIKQPFAAVLGIGPGDRLNFLTDSGESLLVSWPETGLQGPSLGSTRALAESVAAGLEDAILLTFDRERKTVAARLIGPEDDDVASLTGLQIAPGQELEALAHSMGCRPSAVRSALARRGDQDVLNALPREKEQPDLDGALSTLADLLAD